MINPGVFDSERVFHVITDISDGNMSYLHGEEEIVTANRKKLLETLNLAPERMVPCLLPHQDHILTATEETLGHSMFKHDAMIPGYDACITEEKNVFLFMMFADCIPLTLYDTKNEAIALIHLGRISNELHLGSKTIRRMHDKYGTEPEHIVAHIGPSIYKESYIKPKEWFDPKELDAWAKWGDFLGETENGDVSIDNLRYAKHQLLEAGILPEQLFVSQEDTFTSEQYFSHNRTLQNKEKGGRFAVIIGSLL